MTSIVSVCKNDYEFEPRQLPIREFYDKWVLDLNGIYKLVAKRPEKSNHPRQFFLNRFSTLTKDEVAAALLVPAKDILTMLPNVIPCMECRKSAEKLFHQIKKSQPRALEPMIVTPRGDVSLYHSYLHDPYYLYNLFHVQRPKLQLSVAAAVRIMKNKKCFLHTGIPEDTVDTWMVAWKTMEKSCQDEVMGVRLIYMLNNIESYFERESTKFKGKTLVMLALNILIGKIDCSLNESYRPDLYENVRFSTQTGLITATTDDDVFISLTKLAMRDFEVETLDTAQEVVLSCLGVEICTRLHHIYEAMRSETQIWLILMYLGVEALQKSYQAALETKQGVSDFELFCNEQQEKKKRQDMKKKMKKQKRKQKRVEIYAVLINSVSSVSDSNVPCQSHDHSQGPSHGSADQVQPSGSQGGDQFNSPDVGSCEHCKTQERSEYCKCDKTKVPMASLQVKQSQSAYSFHSNKTAPRSLEELLHDFHIADNSDDDLEITEEEIQAFKAQEAEIKIQREQLRLTLKKQFNELYNSRHRDNL